MSTSLVRFIDKPVPGVRDTVTLAVHIIMSDSEFNYGAILHSLLAFRLAVSPVIPTTVGLHWNSSRWLRNMK